MHEGGKSDSPVLPAKPSNKAVAAEMVEGRGLTKGSSAAPKPLILRVRVPSAWITQSTLKLYPTFEGGDSSDESSEVKVSAVREKARVGSTQEASVTTRLCD
jgi:hypothetical protein